MYSFSTIIYLFTDDLGEITAIANLLVLWLINSTYYFSDLLISIYPRVLVLKADHYTRFSKEKATLEFTKELAGEVLRNRNLGQEPNG
jgi:Co/Zn/Cd efflux system component